MELTNVLIGLAVAYALGYMIGYTDGRKKQKDKWLSCSA